MFEDIIFSVIPYETRKNLINKKLGMVFFYTRYIHVNLDAVIVRCPQGLFLPSSSLVESVIFCLWLFGRPFDHYLSQVLSSNPPYYCIVIWHRFNLLYNIYVKFRVIFIWSINATQCHPYPFNIDIKYCVSTNWVGYIFMEINWNTSVDQNAGSTWIACTMGHKDIAHPLIFPITFWSKGRVTFLQ